MPHMTYGYPFESKVLDFARNLSARLAGDRGDQGFLMVFDGDGAVRTVQFECPEDTWHGMTERLDRNAAAYLLYDPFDGAENICLGWRHIDCSTMERLIGDRFAEADFVQAQHAMSRTPDLDPPHTYPASWEVMF